MKSSVPCRFDEYPVQTSAIEPIRYFSEADAARKSAANGALFFLGAAGSVELMKESKGKKKIKPPKTNASQPSLKNLAPAAGQAPKRKPG
jgi:hypothetical protein